MIVSRKCWPDTGAFCEAIFLARATFYWLRRPRRAGHAWLRCLDFPMEPRLAISFPLNYGTAGVPAQRTFARVEQQHGGEPSVSPGGRRLAQLASRSDHRWSGVIGPEYPDEEEFVPVGSCT